MNSDTEQNPLDPEANDIVPADEEYPVDRLKTRVNQQLGGRPLTVYLVLFAGAATLLLLLIVVWLSATGGGDDQNQQICTEIAPADARAAILSGQVERVNILVDKEDPLGSLTGIQLRFADDSCRQTPQGADIRDQLFSVIGAVTMYNNYADDSIRVHYQSQAIESELLATSSPTPGVTNTAVSTETPTEAASPAPPVPTETPLPTMTATPEPSATATQASVRSPTPTV
ncbi:MAG TPA: hypothetical protein PK691_00915 [Thermomicrobiales bacterium]|nr:hypothetical protein [Thermomicrobiales bacterium]HRA47395.1 hypothetical protein [Thermomicrobiales bacterium]